MSSRILIIQGHPDSVGNHFCHALAEHYCKGSAEAGHEARTLEVALLEFPLLRGKDDYDKGTPPDCIIEAQQMINWANHLVFIYPLWLGTMPAMLKGFLEQVARPGFAMEIAENGRWKKLLKGKSARVIVTMGMPAFFYSWFYRAHSLKNLERNILSFVGIKPVRTTLIGMVENIDDNKRQDWLNKMERLGKQAK